jgi:hypothetical protein
MYSNYLLEVVLTSNNSPARVYYHDNKEYIEGRKGSEYKLLFRNKSAYRVLVIPSVDGLDTLDGKPAGVDSRGYVVNGYATVEIPGWRIDNTKCAKFEFAPQSDNNRTYVEALRSDGINVDPQNQGVIGVMVFTEKQKVNWASINTSSGIPYGAISKGGASYDDSDSRGIPISSGGPRSYLGSTTSGMGTPIYDSMNAIPKGLVPNQNSASGYSAGGYTADWHEVATASAGLGTAWGAQTAFHTSQTTFERAYPKTPTFVQVYTYDTIQGLRRRGVPVDEVTRNPTQQAFPGMNDGCYIPKNKR